VESGSGDLPFSIPPGIAAVPGTVTDALRSPELTSANRMRKEILETIGVAIMMGGGPALMYGCDALEALDQFEAKSRSA